MRRSTCAQFDQPLDRGFFERLSAWPTLTINGLHGGYGGPGSKTVLPHEAVAKCDIRLVEAQTADEIFAKVEAHVRQHAPGVELIRQGAMDPSKTPLDSPYAAPIRRGIVAAQGREPLLVPALGGSLPDYVFTKIARHPRLQRPLRQRRRGQPRAEREHGSRALLHGHQDRRGDAGTTRSNEQ